MKSILKTLLFSLLALNLTLNSAFGFDNSAELEEFEKFIASDRQSLQKLKSLCMQDKLWIGSSKKPEFFHEACYMIAFTNLNLYQGDTDATEQKENLYLMEKACNIGIIRFDGCMFFVFQRNALKESLNLSGDYADEDKKAAFAYLKRACDKEWSIFTKNKPKKNPFSRWEFGTNKTEQIKEIDGFYGGLTCANLAFAYGMGIGTDKDIEKAAFYEKRFNEIKKGIK